MAWALYEISVIEAIDDAYNFRSKSLIEALIRDVIISNYETCGNTSAPSIDAFKVRSVCSV